MPQYALNALILLIASIRALGAELRLLSATTKSDPSQTVSDVLKATNLEESAEVDIWVPRVIAEITDTATYKFPQVSVTAAGGTGLAPVLPADLSAAKDALSALGQIPGTGQLLQSLAGLLDKISPQTPTVSK